MFIDESAGYGGIYEEVQNVPGEDNGIENVHEAMLYAIAENEANFNAIMRPIAVTELTALRQGKNTASVWTEGAISGFWEKAKAFFLKLWAKIKGIFAKFMSRIDQFARGGKGFFEKYKKQLADKFARIDKDKVKFMGYKFNETAITSPNSKITGLGSLSFANGGKGLAASDYTKDEDYATNSIENFRGSILSKSEKFTSSEYSKELFEYFRGGDSKEEIDDVSFSYIAGILGNADKAKKGIQDNYKGVEKAINNWIKDCEKAKTADVNTLVDKKSAPADTDSANSRTAGYPVLIRIKKGQLEAAQTYIGAQLKACADEISQAKAFAGQVLRAGVKHESVGFSDAGSADDPFGSVKLR